MVCVRPFIFQRFLAFLDGLGACVSGKNFYQHKPCGACGLVILPIGELVAMGG
jgi:hypothetical protein